MPGNQLALCSASSPTLDLLSRHIVGLEWLDTRVEPREAESGILEYEPAVFVVGSFVVSIQDYWFLVTAGHILEQLELRLKTGRRIVKSFLMDGLAEGPKFPSIPFILGSTPQWSIDADETGLDYGLIPLRPLFANQLIAGGVRPLMEEYWAEPVTNPDGFYMLGLPKGAKRITIKETKDGGNASIRVGTPLLPVSPIDDPPDVLVKATPRFYGKVPIGTGKVDGTTIYLDDIDGMSGGPIFAVEFDGDRVGRYSLIAVQSSWHRSSRTIAGCFVKPLLDTLGKMIDRHQAELEPVQPSS